MRATTTLFVASLRMLLRDRAALMGTVVFPLLFVLVFAMFDLNLSPGGTLEVGVAGQLDYFDFVLPGLLAMGLMNFTMVGIAGSVARFRELRILRRMTVTPVAPVTFIVAQVAARLVLALAQVLIMLGLGIALGASVVGNPLWLLVLATLGNMTFLSLGFAVAGRTTSVDAANNLAGLATAPLMFLSGMFFPVESLPTAVQRIAEVLPITPLIATMREVALEGVGIAELGTPLLILAAWVPISLLLARSSFRFTEA
jgi:ABC-2 type transport system permease protein